MGACFNSMEVEGKASKEEVAKQFNSRCEQDGYECGHSYSGSFSQFTGLVITDKFFNTKEEAEDYVSEHGEKWGPAVAVRYRVITSTKMMEQYQKAIRGLTEKRWESQRKWNLAVSRSRINNNKTVPAYVTKAQANHEKVVARVEPLIAERERKYAEIAARLGAKSKVEKWYLGGWCSS